MASAAPTSAATTVYKKATPTSLGPGTAKRMIAALSTCGRHNATRVPSLAHCANLAVQGTGSLSLTGFLELHNSIWAHHNHDFRLRSYLIDWNTPPDESSLGPELRTMPEWYHTRVNNRSAPSCFLVTMRDLAGRMESMERYITVRMPLSMWAASKDLETKVYIYISIYLYLYLHLYINTYISISISIPIYIYLYM